MTALQVIEKWKRKCSRSRLELLDPNGVLNSVGEEVLHDLIEAAILEEREACAKIADKYNCYCGCGKVVAQALRVRGEKE